MISFQSLWFGEGLSHKETCINLSEKVFCLLASQSSPKSPATNMSIAPCPGLGLPVPIWCTDVLKRSTGRTPVQTPCIAQHGMGISKNGIHSNCSTAACFPHEKTWTEDSHAYCVRPLQVAWQWPLGCCLGTPTMMKLHILAILNTYVFSKLLCWIYFFTIDNSQ